MPHAADMHAVLLVQTLVTCISLSRVYASTANIPAYVSVCVDQPTSVYVLCRLTEDAQQSAPAVRPPASKRTVANLPIISLTNAAALDSIGGPGTACPVCTEELQLQEQVQQLPCDPKHVFHVECLKPWLQQDNSCPVCRRELPTGAENWLWSSAVVIVVMYCCCGAGSRRPRVIRCMESLVYRSLGDQHAQF
jgi:hypothetical protein